MENIYYVNINYVNNFKEKMMLLVIQKQIEIKRKIIEKYVEARAGQTNVLKNFYNRF
jgi:hypothetical protein